MAEGVAIADAARRYLAIDHGAEAIAAHRRTVDQVAAIARRRGDSRWRLLGIEIKDRTDAAAAQPSLERWAADEGLDDWSGDDLQAMYAERFGGADPALRRRQVRNARLRARRLELLRELEEVAGDRAMPSDLLDGWVQPDVVEQLRCAGVLTLTDLQQRIAAGGTWWRGLRAYGPVKAARLARHVEALIGVAAQPAWPLLVTAVATERLSGRHGLNRATALGVGHGVGLKADNDLAAVHAWVAARAGSPLTTQQYEREAERCMLWCILARRKALSDMNVEDCRAYMDFLADIPPAWVSRRHVDHRLAVGWAPFRGQLSIKSRGRAITILHSLFGWLVGANYLASNPWVLVNRKLADDADHPQEAPSSRAFTPAAWAAMAASLRASPDSPSVRRLTWLCTFAEATGLRAAELLRARVDHLQLQPEGWALRVHGKGGKNRLVPVPSAAMSATRAYLSYRGLTLDQTPADTPLLASTLHPTQPITYPALYETFTRFVRRAVAPLPDVERRRVENASTHWLRHTHATRAAEHEVTPDVLQANLGQTDPRTTASYYRAQMARRQAQMERAFGRTNNPHEAKSESSS